MLNNKRKCVIHEISANNHSIYVLLTTTINRNAINMTKMLKPKPKEKPTWESCHKWQRELTEEVVLVSRFRGNTFLRVTIAPVSGCIGS